MRGWTMRSFRGAFRSGAIGKQSGLVWYALTNMSTLSATESNNRASYCCSCRCLRRKYEAFPTAFHESEQHLML